MKLPRRRKFPERGLGEAEVGVETALREVLPPVYRAFMGDVFDRERVSERRATCAECAMCDKGEPSPVPMDYFRPDTKCCTFFPRLPNYLVGAILTDPESAEGAKRIRARIATRIGVTPRFVTRPRKTELVMSQYGAAFGRAKSLLCPYFDDGRCSVWKHREAVCMTYHCKYEAGQRGFDFWTALRKYLALVEHRLAIAAAHAVDPSLVEPERGTLTVEDIEDQPPKDYARFWGAWGSREDEFYARCHEWTKRVSQAEFVQNVDATAEGKHLLDAMAKAHEAIERRTLPMHVMKNPSMTELHVGEKVVVTTYHRYDSFSLDKDVHAVVARFSPDRTLAANLAELEAEGIVLVPELVEFLVTTGVLVPPEGDRPVRIDPKGDLAGRRAALLAILDARGIAVDDETLERVRTAGTATLDTWIRRAALATSHQDVFSDRER
jgi:hypothetical protein